MSYRKAPLPSPPVFADTKPHYELLDGLRGVAALLVLWYHVYEGFAFASGAPVVGGINHGYLAVDFFFMLSGFVIGYAYDDRWSRQLTVKEFLKRRLIRLHPMVIAGALLGALCFVLQGSVQWDGTPVAAPAVMLALLCALFFIPALPGGLAEVRGNGEAFPLNGPAWSLFFEYIGNLVYALFLRRLSPRALTALTAVLGLGLAAFTCLDLSGDGCLSVGWSMQGIGFPAGLLRMLFPFTAGLLLSRRFRPWRVRGAFWLCSLLLGLLFFVPYLPGGGAVSLNGVYETFCLLVAFPLIVWLGASGTATGRFSARTCRLLGDISFPLYIIHYPLMYLFYAWLIDHRLHTLGATWPVALGVCAACLVLAYVLLRCYDEPLRRRLARRFLKQR